MGVHLLYLKLISLPATSKILTYSLQFEKYVVKLLDVDLSVGVGNIELYVSKGIVDLERSHTLSTFWFERKSSQNTLELYPSVMMVQQTP